MKEIRSSPRLSRRAVIAAAPALTLAGRLRAQDTAAAPLTALAGKLVASRMTEGASTAAVLKNGRVVTGVAGWADPDRRLPMRPDTRLMSGSTGKTFCAATTMSLVGDGVLDLDRPLFKLFADELWFARVPNARDLTLRILLMHGGGLPQFLDDMGFRASYFWDRLRGADTAYSPRKMLSFVLDEAPLAAAGKEHHYTDLGYHLVGLAIEKATRRNYYAVLAERILTKLGTDDVLPSTTTALPRLAAGYARGDIIAAIIGRTGKTIDASGKLRAPPNLEYTGGGLALTPRALALFYHKLATGRLIAPRLFEEMMTSSLPVPSGPGTKVRYGLGMFITERPGLGRYVSHSGYYPGYTSNVGYFLDHGFAAAVQLNTDHGPDIYQALRDTADAVIKA